MAGQLVHNPHPDGSGMNFNKLINVSLDWIKIKICNMLAGGPSPEYEDWE